MRLIPILLLTALPALAQTPAAPDTITFTNGDKLTGKLVKAAGGSITFKSSMAGEFTVGFDKVKEITSSGHFIEIAKSSMKKPATIEGDIAVNGDKVVVTPVSGAPDTIPTKDVAYILDQASYEQQEHAQESFFRGWDGKLTGGATLLRSTQSATTLTAGVSLWRGVPFAPYLPGHSRTIVDLTQSYGRESTPVIPPTTPPSEDVVVKTDTFHADLEHDAYFATKVYVLIDFLFDHNYSLGTSLQQIYGTGLGWTAVSSPKQTLDFKIDAHFEHHSYLETPGTGTTEPSLNVVGSIFSESYKRDLAKKVVLKQTANVIPGWTNLHELSANFTAELSIPLYKRLNASVSMIDNFLDDPAPFYKKNSFQFITGVTYNLK